jgi:hypothetical protein
MPSPLSRKVVTHNVKHFALIQLQTVLAPRDGGVGMKDRPLI